MTIHTAVGCARKFLRLAGYVLRVLMVTSAVAAFGIALDHSSLSQLLAPHSYDSLKSQLVLHNGQPYVKDIVVVDGHRTVTVRPIRLREGTHPQGVSRIKTGIAMPPELSGWRQVPINLTLVAVIALVAAGLDRIQRTFFRRRRLARGPKV